jgi:hypothetical protein
LTKARAGGDTLKERKKRTEEEEDGDGMVQEVLKMAEEEKQRG